MSERDVDAFRQAVEAFARGDEEGVLRHYDPDVAWYPGLAANLGGGQTVYRGHQGIRDLVRELREAFSEFEFRFDEYRDLGDRVLAVGEFRAVGRVSGIETVAPVAYLVETEDGIARTVRAYLDPAEALREAGLAE
jgi:ketosteroid isomerase-like protein